MTRGSLVTAVALAMMYAGPAAPADDPEMQELARRAGCTLCHEVPIRREAYVQLPLAPRWRDIAARYAGDAKAEEKLARVVLAGTGPLPRDRHWRGQAYVGDMPNNNVQIPASDARALVRWILATPR